MSSMKNLPVFLLGFHGFKGIPKLRNIHGSMVLNTNLLFYVGAFLLLKKTMALTSDGLNKLSPRIQLV
jgi:hypothetical protein